MKESIARLISLITVMLCLIGSGWGQDRDFSANGAFFSGTYSTEAAMETAYGSYDSASRSTVWTPKQSPVYSEYWPDQIRVHPLEDFTYAGDGVQRHLLVTWARPDESSTQGEYSCHACSVLLGVTAFRNVKNGWRVEASSLQLAAMGAWGQPPDVKLLVLGRRAFGLAIETPDMHQGEVEKGLSIYGPQSAQFTEWFSTELTKLDPSHDYDETCRMGSEVEGACVWYRSTYSMVPRQGAQIYDLLLTKQVVRSFSKKTRVGTFVQRFRFNGTKYVELSYSEQRAKADFFASLQNDNKMSGRNLYSNRRFALADWQILMG
jgi:hypothetical protein